MLIIIIIIIITIIISSSSIISILLLLIITIILIFLMRFVYIKRFLIFFNFKQKVCHRLEINIIIINIIMIQTWLNFPSINYNYAEAMDEIAEKLYAMRKNTALQSRFISIIENRLTSNLASLSIEVHVYIIIIIIIISIIIIINIS